MNILAIDTTTNKLVVELKNANSFVKNQPQNTKKHLEVVLPQIDYVLNQSNTKLEDVDFIAVCVGPGSFTGIRIGIATAKGILCANKNIKVVPVNALDFLAYNIKQQKKKGDFVALIPSTLEKFYALICKDGNEEFKIITKNDVKDLECKVYVTEGVSVEGAEVVDCDNLMEYVEYLIDAGEVGDVLLLKPVYMSLCQAEEELLLKEKKNGI